MTIKLTNKDLKKLLTTTRMEVVAENIKTIHSQTNHLFKLKSSKKR